MNYYYLIGIIGLILILAIFYKPIKKVLISFSEGLDNMSKPIPGEYKYLAPITGTWSSDTQQKFIDKYNSVNNLTGENAVTISMLSQSPTSGMLGWYYNGGMMKYITEEEANYYIQNGVFPYDDYVKNYLSTALNPPASEADLQTYPKFASNRSVYMLIVEPRSVPLGKLLTDMSSMGGQGSDGSKWTCRQGTDGVFGIQQNSSSDWVTSTDYSYFTKNVPGFEFEGEPCNPCQWLSTPSSTEASPWAMIEQFNKRTQCKFTYKKNENPEAYNVFIGDYGTESTPANTNSSSTIDSMTKTSNSSSSQSTVGADYTSYKKCIASCDN